VTQQRIAYFYPQIPPHSNAAFGAALAAEYPDHAFDVIVVRDVVKRKPLFLAANGVATLWHFGWFLLRRRGRVREAFWRTPYFSRRIGALLADHMREGNYVCTVQIQSLFDCRQPGIPNFVYTDHTHLANVRYPSFDDRRLYPSWWVEMERSTYAHAERVLVRSLNIETSLVEQYGIPAERVVVIGCGHNVSRQRDSRPERRYDQQRVLFVGSDWQRKGGPDLVEAFRRVSAHRPGATLTLVGGVPAVTAPNVVVHGMLSQEALPPVYEAADVFCVPTHLEPFGVAFLEAMHFGLPIIATRVGALPDFIDDGWNGLLVEPGDIDALADALARLLDNPDTCRQWGDRNRERVTERYNWRATARNARTAIDASLAGS